MSLINKKDIQTVIIKLDKNKPRELEFRKYLDENVRYGIDRKETILRLWEAISKHDSILNLNIEKAPIVKQEEQEEQEEQNILKTNELNNNINEDDWDCI